MAGLVFPTRPPKPSATFEANAHLARERDDIELGVAGEVVVVNIRDHLGLKTSATFSQLPWDSAFAKTIPDATGSNPNGSKGSNYAEHHAARRKSAAPERSASSKLVQEKAVEERAIEHAVQVRVRV